MIHSIHNTSYSFQDKWLPGHYAFILKSSLPYNFNSVAEPSTPFAEISSGTTQNKVYTLCKQVTALGINLILEQGHTE